MQARPLRFKAPIRERFYKHRKIVCKRSTTDFAKFRSNVSNWATRNKRRNEQTRTPQSSQRPGIFIALADRFRCLHSRADRAVVVLQLHRLRAHRAQSPRRLGRFGKLSRDDSRSTFLEISA